MVGATLQGALQALKAERDRISSAIASIEGLLPGGGGAGRGGRRGRRPGRPAKAAAAAAPAAGRKGKRRNAPRGLLKKTIHEVLKAAGKPLKPVDLRNGVLKAGYPNRNAKTLYTAIFAATKADTAIKKTKAGFRLK